MRRATPVAALAALLLAHSFLAYLSSATTLEDAFISFRYARNLARGNGLVYNVGERVEGYTNFLWVLLLAGVMPLADPVPASKVLGVLADLGLIAIAYRFGRRHAPGLALAIPALVALDPTLVHWATGGLESSLFAALAFLACASAASAEDPRRIAFAGVLAALATLARPEGIIVAAGLALADAAVASPRARRSFAFASGYATLMIPYAVFKLAYYGDLLPNSYHAKTGGGAFQAWRGLAYVTRGFRPAAATMAALLLLAILCRGWRSRALLCCFLPSVALTAGIIQVGGDYLGRDRFLVPVMPFLFAGVVISVNHLFVQPRFSAVGLWLARIALAGLFLWNAEPARRIVATPSIWDPRIEIDAPQAHLGHCLAANAGPKDSLATAQLGRLPYYSDLYIVDMLGLVDPHIASLPPATQGAGAAGHEKTDMAYVLARKPTFLLAPEGFGLAMPPPREYGWLRFLRRHISGDPPRPAPPQALHPPYRGYREEVLRCGEDTYHVFRRVRGGREAAQSPASTIIKSPDPLP